MDILSLTRIIFGNKNKENKEIKVRCPSVAEDISIGMSIQELKEEFKGYLIIDPKAGQQIDLEELANLEIDEVVVIPARGLKII